jgi:hypothetical protein
MFDGDNLASCLLDALVNYSKAATWMRCLVSTRRRERVKGQTYGQVPRGPGSGSRSLRRPCCPESPAQDAGYAHQKQEWCSWKRFVLGGDKSIAQALWQRGSRYGCWEQRGEMQHTRVGIWVVSRSDGGVSRVALGELADITLDGY